MELRRRGVLREGMVVLPGHVGDMGGGWLPRTLFDDPAARWDGAAASRLVYDAFYDQNVPTASRRARLLERLERSFRGREYPSADALLDDYITWVFRVRGANFLVNAVRVYEYWGLDWRLPLCEMHYKLLWYSVPWKTKIGSKLYDEFLFQYYFEPFDVPFRKPVPVPPGGALRRAVKSLCPSFALRCVRRVRGFVRRLRPAAHFNAFDDVVRILKRKVPPPSRFPGIRRMNASGGHMINAVVARYYLELVRRSIDGERG